jgi:DHA2 family multidrug resistance protein-like MFS transporter
MAPSLLALSLARVVQGLGAAGIMSVNAALVRHTYPQAMLGRAVGINAFFIACAAAVGPAVASAVLAVAHWRWLFAINIPIGVLTLLIAMYALPHTERHRRRLNLVGALLNAAAFGLLISGLQAFSHDEALLLSVLQLLAGCLVGWMLVRHERARSSPLIPFDLLGIPLFRLSVLTSVCSFTAQMAALVALPFALQHLGHSPVETGLLMTPWPVGVALSAPVSGHLADRHPAGLLGAIGLGVNALGLALLAALPAGSPTLVLMACMALCGLGFGFFQAPNNRAMLGAAPRKRSGAAGGMLSTARLVGQSLGAAGVAVLFRLGGVKGPTTVLTVAAVIAFLSAWVSLARLKAGGPADPEPASP